MSTQEAHKLSEIDKMLLGEVEITTTTDGPVKVHKDEPSAPDGNGFNGAMGPDSMLDQKVNEIKSEDNKDIEVTSMEPPKVVPQKRRAPATNGANDDPALKKTRSATKSKAIKNEDTTMDDENNEEAIEPVTPKARTPRKKAATKTATAANENGDRTTTDAVIPATPSPKKRTAAKAAGDTVMDGDEDPTTPLKSTAVEGTNVRGTPRKRAVPKEGTVKPRGIPNSYEEADAADRMLVAMKEEQDKSWSEIRQAWKTMTGFDTAASTLPNRYNRIKVNMMRFKTGDEAKLMNAVKDVEDNLEKEKWNLISHAMSKRNASAYPTLFLQKKHKEFTEAIKNGKGDELLDAMKKEAERFANGDFSSDGDADESGLGSGADVEVKEEAEEVAAAA